MTKSPTSTVGTGSIDLGTGTAMGTSATLAPPAEESLLGMPPEHGSYHLLPEDMKRAEPEWMLGELINVLPQNNGRLSRLNSVQMDSFPSELFDMELSTFLQPGVVYDPFQGLHT